MLQIQTTSRSVDAQQVVDAAIAQAATNGLHSLTLRDLAQALGKSTTVIVNLFGAKSGLVQAVGEEATAVDEIVVTALRRSTSLQKVPASITAVTGETLQNMGISDSFQLSRIAPGLVIREAANGGGRVTIRNIQSAGESTVGLYYDETPVEGSPGLSTDAGGSMPDIRLFDVRRKRPTFFPFREVADFSTAASRESPARSRAHRRSCGVIGICSAIAPRSRQARPKIRRSPVEGTGYQSAAMWAFMWDENGRSLNSSMIPTGSGGQRGFRSRQSWRAF